MHKGVEKWRQRHLARWALVGAVAVVGGSVGISPAFGQPAAPVPTIARSVAYPYLTAAFDPDTVNVDATARLELTIHGTQPNPNTVITGLGYSISLPAGLTITTGAQPDTCQSSTVTAAPGTTTITVAGAQVTGTETCQLSIPTSTGLAGVYEVGHPNVTSTTLLTNQVGCPVAMPASEPSGPCEGTLTVVEIPPPPAPSNVTANRGVTSIEVSWTKPTDITDVTGYRVIAEPGPATCTTSSPTEVSCLIGGTPGTAYTYTVVALGPGGTSTAAGPSNEVVPTTLTPTDEPPTTRLTLTTTDGKITTADPGERITFVGTGFLPFSTVVISVYSTPIGLGTTITRANGSFRKQITVPASLAAGSHVVSAQGIAPDGSPRYLNLAVVINGLPATGAVTGGALLMVLLLGLGCLATGAGMLSLTSPRRCRPSTPKGLSW